MLEELQWDYARQCAAGLRNGTAARTVEFVNAVTRCRSRLNADLATIEGALAEIGAGDTALDAAVLYGSYGRDEGGWIINDDGVCTPYNDYDLLLVLENAIPETVLRSLRGRLAAALGIRWVDISQMSKGSLARMRPSVLAFDIKYASTVFAGDPKVLGIIPEIDASDLSLREVEKLFFTRMWTFLGGPGAEPIETSRTGEPARFFKSQMAKATLAVVDAILIDGGRYHPSYRERVQRLKREYAERVDLCELASWALQERLRPSAAPLDGRAASALYSRVLSHYLNEMPRILCDYYGMSITGPHDIEHHLFRTPVSLCKRLGIAVIQRSLRRERQLRVNCAQMYLAYAQLAPEQRASYVGRATALMRRVLRGLPREMSWDEARKTAADARMEA